MSSQAVVSLPAVARTWLQIRVDLLGTAASDLDPCPGRILIVAPAHTFEELADAINQAFARWDLSHLHEFELADGAGSASRATSTRPSSSGRTRRR